MNNGVGRRQPGEKASARCSCTASSWMPAVGTGERGKVLVQHVGDE